MQIHLTTDTEWNRRKLRKHGVANSSSVETQDPFHSILNEILPMQEEVNVDLNRLWKELPIAEKSFLRNPKQENLEHYRKIVVEIAKETIRKNTCLRKLKKKNSKGDLVELNLVEFIDIRLQKMVLLIHSPQNSAFALLRTIEEIRGILLDARG